MPDAALPPLDWDLFCRVIDNHGDLGVCWRLARRLAALGQRVRLWIDDAGALAWMAPDGDPGVRVRPWRDPQPDEAPGDVVVEAFGCDPPPAFVARMAGAARAPVWVNLEYLSAEPYTLRSHGLPSPQAGGPGAGLTKWFFFPGFVPASGGLLLEDGLAEARAVFDAEAWLASLGISPLPQRPRRSLFCYDQPALAAALAEAREQPSQWLVTPGPAARQVADLLGVAPEPGRTAALGASTLHFLPWLSQPDFDRLLWACGLNHVRGEDSPTRALWAGRPFLWQLYPQQDGAHAAKLEAFLDVYLDGADAALAGALRRRFRHWNGLVPDPGAAPDAAVWRRHAASRRDALEAVQRASGDLGRRLCRFVAARR